MFTGIVKAIGTIESMQPTGGDLRLSVTAAGVPWTELGLGESISVNGVCLTATELSGDGFVADVSVETMNVTALSGLQQGSRVNLETALAVGDRLGGHIVSGHVDCVGTVTSIDKDARSIRLGIDIPGPYRRYTAAKGSICIDGVSLTINNVSATGVETNIIPHTANETIIGAYQPGTRVNIEVDLLARYLERLLTGDDRSDISIEFLKAHGYV